MALWLVHAISAFTSLLDEMLHVIDSRNSLGIWRPDLRRAHGGFIQFLRLGANRLPGPS